MSTNRTKIDWAYMWAKKFLSDMGRFSFNSGDPDDIRALAALLRRAARRARVPEGK